MINSSLNDCGGFLMAFEAIFFLQIKIFMLIQTLQYDAVCSCHVTYVFQSEFTHSCLHVKELLAWSRHEIWSLSVCNWTQTHSHLVRKQTLNHLAKLTKWFSVCLWTKWLWVRVQLQSLSCNMMFDIPSKANFLCFLTCSASNQYSPSVHPRYIQPVNMISRLYFLIHCHDFPSLFVYLIKFAFCPFRKSMYSLPWCYSYPWVYFSWLILFSKMFPKAFWSLFP